MTADGGATRVPIFNRQRPLGPFNIDPFAETSACGTSCQSIDASGTSQLCHRVAETTWTSTLPCGLDLAPLATDRDSTLVVSASDGVVDPPATATAPFTRVSQTALTVNGATCP
ncbi:MAG: hypothetical protein ABIR79_21790 [Candidatus Binatia bacterium]